MRLGAREGGFFAAASDSGQKSIGLGLNIVKEIAVLHKGDVKLENRPGRPGNLDSSRSGSILRRHLSTGWWG